MTDSNVYIYIERERERENPTGSLIEFRSGSQSSLGLGYRV
jgi:hypothetical protein